MSNEEAAKAVGHIPSGLFVVCAHDKSESVTDGYLASWIQQVSFEPLLISIAVKPGRPAYDLIKSGINFSINVVGEHSKNYMKHFWSGYDADKNPFSEIDHKLTDSGVIVMSEAKSTIECKLIESFQPGDHEIVIAEVLRSYIQNDEAKPVTHIRKTGLDY
jgi:flavin reductase (DIM6/NTAB) family NADH-FMN oxidoreductase RutF